MKVRSSAKATKGIRLHEVFFACCRRFRNKEIMFIKENRHEAHARTGAMFVRVEIGYGPVPTIVCRH
jgi:hypothetical protein